MVLSRLTNLFALEDDAFTRSYSQFKILKAVGSRGCCYAVPDMPGASSCRIEMCLLALWLNRNTVRPKQFARIESNTGENE